MRESSQRRNQRLISEVLMFGALQRQHIAAVLAQRGCQIRGVRCIQIRIHVASGTSDQSEIIVRRIHEEKSLIRPAGLDSPEEPAIHVDRRMHPRIRGAQLRCRRATERMPDRPG